MLTAEPLIECASQLGEGPTWDADQQRLLWLDIDGRVLHELADGNHRSTNLAERVTCVVPDTDGGLIATSGHRVFVLNQDGTSGPDVATLPPDGPDGTNDGRCDPWGRLWIGTVDRGGERRAGLYRVSSGGEVATMRTGVALSNGIDWSPDSTTAYYVDSLSHRLDAISLDADGSPLESRVVAEVDGIPDGLTVDSDGCIWVAQWDGGGVHRITPDGRRDKFVEVPGGFVTSCAFGDDTTLYITTAIATLSDPERAALPHAGALFAVDAGVSGRGYTSFRLG